MDDPRADSDERIGSGDEAEQSGDVTAVNATACRPFWSSTGPVRDGSTLTLNAFSGSWIRCAVPVPKTSRPTASWPGCGQTLERHAVTSDYPIEIL